MSQAVTAYARTIAETLVEREERHLGSRMAAYRVVARTVGTSASWLRKFIAHSAEAKQPNLAVGWNILTEYRQLCERIERAAEAEIALAQTLRRQGDEIVAGTLEMVARETGAPEGGESQC